MDKLPWDCGHVLMNVYPAIYICTITILSKLESTYTNMQVCTHHFPCTHIFILKFNGAQTALDFPHTVILQHLEFCSVYSRIFLMQIVRVMEIICLKVEFSTWRDYKHDKVAMSRNRFSKMIPTSWMEVTGFLSFLFFLYFLLSFSLPFLFLSLQWSNSHCKAFKNAKISKTKI